MKINDIIAGKQIEANKIAKNQEKGTAASFQEILASQLRAGGKTEAGESVSPLSSVTAVSPSLRLDSLLTTENTISTLEQFSAALANPAFTESDLEPFASELENDTAALVDLKNQLPNDDPLAALLDRVATVSYVEAAKFRRGDYTA
ncbi:hypothetical protein ACUUL3_16295 [Thiovibrio sp. JS02]